VSNERIQYELKSMPLSPKVKVTLSSTNYRPEDNDLTSARGRTEHF